MDCSLIKDIFDFISQLCAGRIVYVCELEENLNTLRTSMDELRDIRYDVIEIQPGETIPMRKELVAGWLERANAIENEVDEILRDCSRETEGRCLGGFCPRNCCASYKLGEKLVQIIEEVAELKGEGGDLFIVAPPPPVLEMPGEPIIGLDFIFKEAWSFISDERLGIVGIYGMGGVGKTTLLKRINNKFYEEFLSRGRLDLMVVWLVISKEVHILKIQDDIANRLGFSLPTDVSLDFRASILHFALSEKKFLLLLDDIWERIDLGAIGIPHPTIKNNCKILFTTRSKFVCGQMEAQKNIKVECLSQQEAWKLFEEKVGEEFLNSHPAISALAQTVADKCAGLPLALATIGEAMSSKKTLEEWERAGSILEESAWELSAMVDEVFPVLMFSYHSLPNDTIRSCFLECSLFSKGGSIKIDQLIDSWNNKGLLDGFNDEDGRGYFIVGILKEACLLETDQYSPPRTVWMHDILWDLALWIAKCDRFLKPADVDLMKVRESTTFKPGGLAIGVGEPPPVPEQEMPVVPRTATDTVFEKAWSFIREEQVGIVGIYGISGVGKTTLLKRIHRKFQDEGNCGFDVVIFVTVSSKINVRRIQEDVAQCMGLPVRRNDLALERQRVGLPVKRNDLVLEIQRMGLHVGRALELRRMRLPVGRNDLALELHNVLSQKKFVLLLDNISEPINLDDIGIPRPDIKKHSKVFCTSRSELVCLQMKAHEKIRVACLDWPEAWKLFEEKVGATALSSHPKIPVLAKLVAKECAGLPLALVTIGQAMSSKKSLRDWEHAVTDLKRCASEFSGMGDVVFPKLKLCYDSLPGNTIKTCFLYCSLFPEDHSIEIDHLIRYWIGEGFLDEYNGMDETLNGGYGIVSVLKEAGLLESGIDFPTKEVKMHHIIRDMALWIGGDLGNKQGKFLVESSTDLRNEPEVGKWGVAERISFMNSNIQSLGNEIPVCPNLLTFILHNNSKLEDISPNFFQHMHVLKVLDLSGTNIHEFPISIVRLVRLQYLGLARTRIKELPQEMKTLMNLKYLDLSDTYYLKIIPFGMLSKFLKLQVLDFKGSSFGHWNEKDYGGEDDGRGTASIEELECLDLKHLSICLTNSASVNKLLTSVKFTKCTIRLHINRCKGLTGNRCLLQNLREVYIKDCEVQNLLWLHDARALELLDVTFCRGLEFVCMENAYFPNLRRVDIRGCHQLLHLLWLDHAPKLEFLNVHDCVRLEKICSASLDGRFPNLHEVSISNCGYLWNLSWLTGAPNLKSLHVKDCKGLEVICGGPTDGYFPNLHEVSISNCLCLRNLSWLIGAPNLESLHVNYSWALEVICEGPTDGCFPNLHEVSISNCQNLRNLSWLIGAPNLESLHVNYCWGLEVICEGPTDGCFPNLHDVSIDYCQYLRNLSWLIGAPNLELLEVKNCRDLEVICEGPTDGCFPNLHEVSISNCWCLRNLSWLIGAPNLGSLQVSYCGGLEVICEGPTDGYFPNLHEVSISNCQNLRNLSWLIGAPNLESLHVHYCTGLNVIFEGLMDGPFFPKLHEASITDCNSLWIYHRRKAPTKHNYGLTDKLKGLQR